MPFALDGNPTQSEISEAINYLLANFSPNVVVDQTTGQVISPGGFVVSYLYQYIAVKYSDSIDGSTNFSNTPTNREYYGVRNSNDSTESTNPTDYVWTKVSGGFGTTKFLYYQTNGGRQIQFQIATTSPGDTWELEAGTSIDLDIITGSSGYMSAFPTIYKWTSTSTAPSRPTTTSTYTWATGAYTAPSGWTTTITTNSTPGSYLWSITVPMIVPSTTTSTVADWTNTSYSIVNISYNGTNGTNGTTGATGPRSASGYIYYSLASASTPSAPSASGYNFDTGAFSSLTTNWSTTFTAPDPVTNPSTEAGSKFWAVRYNVSEATYGGTQTVTLSSRFNWQNLDGLVTFTNISAPSGTTFIDGGNIKADTVTVNKLAAGTATIATGVTFSLGAGSSVFGYSAAGVFGSTSASYQGVLGYSTNNTIGVAGVGYGTTYGVGGIFGRATSSAMTSFYSLNEVGGRYFGGNFTYRVAGNTTITLQSILAYQDSTTSAYYAGVFTNAANNTGGYVGVNGYDFYAFGGGTNYGPFTGAHDALLDKSYTLEAGDIVADTGFAIKSGVSNTVTQVVPCTSANQAGSLGVFVGIYNNHAPNAMSDVVDGILVIKPEYEPLLVDNNIIAVNAVGEGQINVCGQGGDIQVGDFIVSSNIVGKGMKQSDDLLHSYTIAKARENVTFSSPTEVKQIACIYVAG